MRAASTRQEQRSAGAMLISAKWYSLSKLAIAPSGSGNFVSAPVPTMTVRCTEKSESLQYLRSVLMGYATTNTRLVHAKRMDASMCTQWPSVSREESTWVL